MQEDVEKKDLVNGGLLGVVILVACLLIAVLAFWFRDMITNDVIVAEKAEEDKDEGLPITSARDRTVVQVANATDRVGFAGEANNRLENHDYVVRNPLNTEESRESFIYFQTDPVTRQTEAKDIAKQLNLPEEIVAPFPDDFQLEGLDKEAEVLVVLGSNARL